MRIPNATRIHRGAVLGPLERVVAFFVAASFGATRVVATRVVATRLVATRVVATPVIATPVIATPVLATILATAVVATTGAVAAASPGAAGASADWTLSVCAQENDLPFSNPSERGFELEIADVLADELHASVEVTWKAFERDLFEGLRAGECDALMGVPDGFGELLTTVPYYRGSYVFVVRASAPFDLTSFDDPVLATLDVGVQHVRIPPYQALAARGLADRVVRQYGTDRLDDQAGVRQLVRDVGAGSIDVGIAWGPPASYFARQSGSELRVVPVAPQIDPPFVAMTFPIVIAVRPGDEALRDELSGALQARWDEVQHILRTYGVSDSGVTAPRIRGADAGSGAAPADPSAISGAGGAPAVVGIVLPMPVGGGTRFASPTDAVALAAERGALLAEEELDARSARSGGTRVDAVFASAPSTGAAHRAAERLLAVEGADALVGGIGAEEARALARVAEDHAVPFLNIGSPLDALRAPANAYTFHVEAAASDYLDALAAWFASRGHRAWFVVHESGRAGRLQLDAAARSIASCTTTGRVAASEAVDAAATYFGPLVEEIVSSSADVVLLFVPPAQQLAIMAQLAAAGAEIAVAPFPHAETQTRVFLAASVFRAGAIAGGFRVHLWDPSLAGSAAAALNERFAARFGAPMESAAWAAYEAVALIHDAVSSLEGDADPSDLARSLQDGGVVDADKGRGTSFDRTTRQLAQPLYAVEVDESATWGGTPAARTAVAQVVDELRPSCR